MFVNIIKERKVYSRCATFSVVSSVALMLVEDAAAFADGDTVLLLRITSGSTGLISSFFSLLSVAITFVLSSFITLLSWVALGTVWTFKSLTSVRGDYIAMTKEPCKWRECPWYNYISYKIVITSIDSLVDPLHPHWPIFASSMCRICSTNVQISIQQGGSVHNNRKFKRVQLTQYNFWPPIDAHRLVHMAHRTCMHGLSSISNFHFCTDFH